VYLGWRPADSTDIISATELSACDSLAWTARQLQSQWRQIKVLCSHHFSLRYSIVTVMIRPLGLVGRTFTSAVPHWIWQSVLMHGKCYLLTVRKSKV